MSIEPAVNTLRDLIRPSGRSKIKNYDMSDIWKVIFQSTKLPEQINEVSSLLSQAIKINPRLRTTPCRIVEVIINNFSSPSIEADQRFEASLPIFRLLSFYDDKSIAKTAISMVDVFSAYTEKLEDVPFDVLSDYSPYEGLPKAPLREVLNNFKGLIGGKNEVPMALVFSALYKEFVENVPETKEFMEKLIISLLKGNVISVAVCSNLLAKSSSFFDKLMPLTQNLMLTLYKLLNCDVQMIAENIYETIKAALNAGFFVTDRNMAKIFNTRLVMQSENVNRIYKLLSIFIEKNNKEKVNVAMMRSLSHGLHQVIIDRETSEQEEGYAFMCQASIIDTCEGIIQNAYKEELKAAKYYVDRALIHSYAGISTFLCSISGLVGLKGSAKVTELIPSIVAAAKTKELSISEKEIIGRSLSIIVSSGRWHHLREIVTELAEYQMNDAKKEVSIIGTEMVRELGGMVALNKIADLSASMIDIIETDADVDVVMNTFKALNTLLSNFEFEPSSFDNILSLLANNKLECTKDLLSVDNAWPAFHFVELFAEKYPEDCGEIAQQLAEWALTIPDKMLKCIFRPLSKCIMNCIVNRSQVEECIPRELELLGTLTVADEKLHSCIIETLWYTFHQSHEGFDVTELYEAVKSVVVLYDHPIKGGELKGLGFAAMIILEIAVQCTDVVTVPDAIIIAMIHEMPFKPEYYIMDTAMKYVISLISDQFRFGQERFMIFKLITKILMMDDKTLRKYYFEDSTLILMHEKLQLECKTNGYVMCNLDTYYKDEDAETITFDSLLK